jgi:uncharacterized membrane protein YhaH (DUF805 family)
MSWYQWYPVVIRRYVDFDGRASRPEFWWYQLCNVIIVAVLTVIGHAVNDRNAIADLYNLAVLLPSLAVGIRRLHDINRSGWWLLLNLLPIIGWIIIIIWAASAGTPGPNRYGVGPRGPGNEPPAAPATAAWPAPDQPSASPGEDAPGATARYCARCGSPITPGSAFCGNCGAPVGSSS